eukprot:5653805-Prymnesium_polylepis.2
MPSRSGSKQPPKGCRGDLRHRVEWQAREARSGEHGAGMGRQGPALLRVVQCCRHRAEGYPPEARLGKF